VAARGRSTGRPAVTLEEGAAPGDPRCPACGEPLFVWVETEGWGPREEQIFDRCESCGLVAARDSVPGPEQAVADLVGAGGNGGAEVEIRTANGASVQAWLGAENWAALRPGDRTLKPSPRAVELLLAHRGLEPGRVSFAVAAGMAAMWQTLLNLLTFHRDFAAEALARRLHPRGAKARAAYAIDAIVTVLAAVPTAILAVLIEAAAVLARRGGVVEVSARRPG
jgi:hypothetical protein